MRVIVAGAGIGGLTAALALARRGASVTVLERADALGEVGAGLQLSPNATRLLFGLGLEDGLRALAFAPGSADIYDREDGRRLLTTPLGAGAEARWGAPYLQAHRADLHALLLEAVGVKGVWLRTASPLDSFEQDDRGVEVRVAGETLHADVVVGADGIHSAVRTRMTGPRRARFTGQIAWRGLVEASRLPPGLVAPAATVWTGPGSHFVHYYVRGGALVNFVGFTRGASPGRESWTQAAAPAEIAQAFEGWPEPVRALIAAQAEAGDPGWRSAVHDRKPSPNWSDGRVALMGDAAHPMPPYLAQGAGMAVEDAEALARHLAGDLAPGAALKAYAAERYERTRRVQAWATRNGSIFHLPRAVRRAAFGIARMGDPRLRLDWLYGYSPPQSLRDVG